MSKSQSMEEVGDEGKNDLKHYTRLQGTPKFLVSKFSNSKVDFGTNLIGCQSFYNLFRFNFVPKTPFKEVVVVVEHKSMDPKLQKLYFELKSRWEFDYWDPKIFGVLYYSLHIWHKVTYNVDTVL